MTLRYILAKGFYEQIAERLARECADDNEAFAIKEIERQIRKCDLEIDKHFDLFYKAENDEFRKRMNAKATELAEHKKTLVGELVRLKNNENKRMTEEDMLILFIGILSGAEAAKDDFVEFIIKNFVKSEYVYDDEDMTIYYTVGNDQTPKKIPRETRVEHKKKAEPLSPANSSDNTVRISDIMVHQKCDWISMNLGILFLS